MRYFAHHFVHRCMPGVILLAGLTGGVATAADLPPAAWSPKAAAAYLDERSSWWMTWPKAARDHDTFCISCHTMLPYALARPALRRTLAEQSPSANEQRVFDNIVKRVRMWKDVEPFYSDQTSGLPKTSESRGTESIINSITLVWRDAPSGRLSADARLALDNMWALQLKSGEMNGSWAWLQFHNAPWEGDSQYYGTALAAIAIGSAPEDYVSEPGIQAGLKLLRTLLAEWHEYANTGGSRRIAVGLRKDTWSSNRGAAKDHYRRDNCQAARGRGLQLVRLSRVHGSGRTIRRRTQQATVMPRAWSLWPSSRQQRPGSTFFETCTRVAEPESKSGGRPVDGRFTE